MSLVIKRNYTINKLEQRVEKLERTLEDFMNKWDTHIQRKRDERDERWDEMVRVLTVQERNKKMKYKIGVDVDSVLRDFR